MALFDRGLKLLLPVPSNFGSFSTHRHISRSSTVAPSSERLCQTRSIFSFILCKSANNVTLRSIGSSSCTRLAWSNHRDIDAMPHGNPSSRFLSNRHRPWSSSDQLGPKEILDTASVELSLSVSLMMNPKPPHFGQHCRFGI